MDPDTPARFQALVDTPWHGVFADPCTGRWDDRWALDGDRAVITHSPQGMTLNAGPVAGQDADHAVLWTRAHFRGDLKITYTFTKMDEQVRDVNILYLLATGDPATGVDPDILAWRERRREPAMRWYFNHMNAYHVSYAAFGTQNQDPDADYIRARRYRPAAGRGLRGTALPPDHARTGLFGTGVPHQVTVLKHGSDLFMHLRNPMGERLCHWPTGGRPPIHEGRIGLRHMAARVSRYRDFCVSVPAGTR